MKVPVTIDQILDLLGDESTSLLEYTCTKIPKDKIHIPSKTTVDKVFQNSDRNNRVLGSLQRLFSHGRLKNSGYLSILPVDQGIEHSAGASFSPNPMYFNPDNIVELALKGGCNAVASTLGVLGLTSRKYAHKIPYIVKINHNDLLTYPNKFDQILFAQVQQAYDMGAVGIGATIYFGSSESSRQIQEISEIFALSHELGMFNVLWCYLRNSEFKRDGIDYHTSADLTAQANHLGSTIGADIVKQKLPDVNGGYKALNTGTSSYGKYTSKMYDDLVTDHPIDLVRYQVSHSYMGKVGLINSGGASGNNDLVEVIRTAVINKRGGGCGLISGRKVFQKNFDEGIGLLNTIQNVYLTKSIKVA